MVEEKILGYFYKDTHLTHLIHEASLPKIPFQKVLLPVIITLGLILTWIFWQDKHSDHNRIEKKGGPRLPSKCLRWKLFIAIVFIGIPIPLLVVGLSGSHDG